MRRFFLIAVLVFITLFTVTAGLAWYLLENETFLKSRISSIALKQTGRTLTIEGPLRIALGREIKVDASGLVFGNAEWAEDPEMVRIGRLLLTVDLPSLFSELPIIPKIAIEDCGIDLLRNEAGEANWDVLPESEEEDEPERPQRKGLLLLIEHGSISNCRLELHDPERVSPLMVEVDHLTLQLTEDGHAEIEGAARLNGEDMALSGWLNPINAFKDGTALEHELRYSRGDISLRSSGRFENASTLGGANISATFQAPDIAKLLEEANLPPFSEGAANFRLGLISEGGTTRLDLKGDLGSLDVNASGELDRLVQPQSGQVHLEVTGPDLAALGEAFGAPGLVPDPFELRGEVAFESGKVKADSLVLKTSEDHLEITGTLGRAPEFADSDLVITATSSEVGRWRGRMGLPTRIVGALHLDGAISSDADGLFSARAELAYVDSTFSVAGTLGQVGGLIEPDLRFTLESVNVDALARSLDLDTFPITPVNAGGRVAVKASLVHLSGVHVALANHEVSINGVVNPVRPFAGTVLDVRLESPDASELGALFHQDTLPAATLAAKGKFAIPESRLELSEVELDLAGNRAFVDGSIDLENNFVGSELHVRLDIPDAEAFGLLFGEDGLPRQPWKLSSILKPEGKGLAFRVDESELGDIRLALDGKIADLDNPLGIDADFDVHLPSLQLIGFLVPESGLPDLPFAAVGHLLNEQDSTRLENVSVRIGQSEAQIDGSIYSDNRFDVSVRARGPDASRLGDWLEQPLPPQAWSVDTSLGGDPSEIVINDLNVLLGRSNASGSLEIGLGEVKRIEGRIDSEFLDLSWWQPPEESEEPQEAAPPSDYVFDETPVMKVADYGIEADVDLSLKEIDLGNTTVHDLEVGILIGGNYLELDPLSVRGSGGDSVSGTAVLDGRGAKPQLNFDMSAKGLRLGLAAAEGQDPSTFPPVNIKLSLQGTGETRREMASGLNGKLRINMGSGQIASSGISMLMNDFLTELFTTLNPFAETSEYTKLDCAVMAADIVSGQVAVGPTIFHTEQLTILSHGKIDLKTEKLNLSFNTKIRQGLGLSAGSLINPFIKVGGRLAAPAVEIDPAGSVISGGLAVATAGISLVAKSMTDRFLSSKDPCGDASKEIAKRDE